MTLQYLKACPAAARAAILIPATMALASCDLSVTNPGGTPDEYLNEQAAWQAVVNGVGFRLSQQLADIAQDVGIRTREIHATATNTYFYVWPDAHAGIVDPEDNFQYNHAARWLADDAIRRFSEVIGEGELARNPYAAEAYLWGGYAHRLMGEYFCDAVFDGGPLEPGSEWFVRAEERFTNALEAAQGAGRTDLAMAARAGRASARANLRDWAGAAADAAQVPTDFEFEMPYYTTGNWRDYNILYYHTAPEATAQVLTVWNTFYEDYYSETGDPRVPWIAGDREHGSGSLQPWGAIPWLRPAKYNAPDDPVRLSSGQEMRLIEAEVSLIAGDVTAAMVLINGLRTAAGVDPWPQPANLEEAWTLLKRERGIVLWMEGRRLMDFRRWREDGTPGSLNEYELGLTAPMGQPGPDLREAAVCKLIPNSERNENPNIPTL